MTQLLLALKAVPDIVRCHSSEHQWHQGVRLVSHVCLADLELRQSGRWHTLVLRWTVAIRLAVALHPSAVGGKEGDSRQHTAEVVSHILACMFCGWALLPHTCRLLCHVTL
jgi:hypothetical protein